MSTLSLSDNIDFVRTFYAKKILEDSQKKYDEQVPTELPRPRVEERTTLRATELAGTGISAAADNSLPGAGIEVARFRETPDAAIGILGAGVAGLYTALMIESLGPDSGITYQILEADEPERIGGRLYTHKFKGYTQDDYYDVGAMRFPNIRPQRRLFDLFERLGLSDKRIPYVMSNDKNDILYFNKIAMKVAAYKESSSDDPFKTGLDPKKTEKEFNKAIKPFKEALKEDFDKGWAMLMEQDRHSMRTYLSFQKKFSEPMIDWLETFNDSTASFDRAFSENVLDSLMFDYQDTVKWYTLQGGSKVLVDAIIAKIRTKPETGKRVVALDINLGRKDERPQVIVTVNDEKKPKRIYDHVVSTLPFGSLRLVDTTGCQMPFALQQAIQCLQYGPSVKVAMRFSTRWWETEQNQNHRGGVSRTDRPTRMVIYPSYGIDTKAATMIVSYTWTQDAQRNAAFIKGAAADVVLRNSILSDLAQIHGVKYSWLLEQYQDHHAWSWDNSEFSVGAFALFGPSQFRALYPEITKPLHEALHFAGEACSVYHAWVVGALESAYNALFQLLALRKKTHPEPDLVKRLQEKWKGDVLAEEEETLALRQVAIGERELELLKGVVSTS